MITERPKQPRNKAHDVFCVIVFIIALITLVCNLVCSCAVQKPTVLVRDSVRVEIRERIVRDTIKYTLPPSVMVVDTKDTTSHLESPYATSDASISGGILHHTLVTSDQEVNVPVNTTVHDTLYFEAKDNTIYVEVPRQPTKWEIFLEICGWIFLGTILLVIAIIVLRICLHR